LIFVYIVAGEMGVGPDADSSDRTGPVVTLLSDCVIMCLIRIRLIELRLVCSTIVPLSKPQPSQRQADTSWIFVPQ